MVVHIYDVSDIESNPGILANLELKLIENLRVTAKPPCLGLEILEAVSRRANQLHFDVVVYNQKEDHSSSEGILNVLVNYYRRV